MDGSGFRKLRIVMAAGVAGSTVAPGLMPPAGAAEQDTPASYSAISSKWNALSFAFEIPSFGSGQGYGLGTGQLRGTEQNCFQSPTPNGGFRTTCFPFNTTLPGALPGGGFLLKVNGAVYQEPDGKIDVSGNTFTSSRKLKGFRVEHRAIFFPGGRAAILYTFKNPRTTSRRATVLVGTQLGVSNVTQTESGDPVLTTEDAWFVDSPIANPSSTPVIKIARGDCDAASGAPCTHPTILQVPTDGNTHWVERYSFRIGPRKAKRLLFYIDMDEDTASNPQVYNDGASLFVANLLPLTDKEKAQVVNWRDLP